MKFDIHIHSKYSNDGVLEINEIIKIAKKVGLDGIAITDHNSMEAYRKIESKEIEIIKGVEISSASGHIIALNINEIIPKGLSVDETIERIHEQGGIAIAVHPYRFWSGLGEENIVGKKFDVIEVLNGRCKKLNNQRAMDLAQRLNKPFSAGSDAHFAGEIGRAYIISDGDPVEKILKKDVRVDGSSRDFFGTIKYVTNTIFHWAGRGFRRI